QYPGLRWHRFEPIGDARQSEAMTLSFGRTAMPHYRLDRCDVIVSLDEDFLGAGPRQVTNALGWSTRRGEAVPGQNRSRLHVAEALPSLTGTVASTRLPCDPSRIAALAQALGARFALAGWSAPPLSEQEQSWLDRGASELQAHRGRSL